MSDSEYEGMVKAAGFSGLAEFHRLVASVPLTDAAAIAAFKKWQNEDGSKRGLLALFPPGESVS